MIDITDYTRELTIAAHTNSLSPEVMMPAIEQLSSPQDRRTYFNTYVELAREAVQVDILNGVKRDTADQVRSGRSIDDVARELALERFRLLIYDYDSAHIHRVWNTAIPELKTI